MVQTVSRTVWRFVVVKKTIEISQLQFIDKVLPYVVAQRQIPHGAETVQKTVVFRSCNSLRVRGSSWTRLSSWPLRVQTVLGVQT